MATIKIYVANLGKYNEGVLQGDWFTLPAYMDDISEKIGLNDEYEEWAIHDEAPFSINEYDSIDKLNELAEAIENLDEDKINAVCALIEYNIASDYMDAIDKLDNVIFHHEESVADIAYKWHEEAGTDMDNPLIYYVDWKKVGRDMELERTLIEVEHGLWIECLD